MHQMYSMNTLPALILVLFVSLTPLVHSGPSFVPNNFNSNNFFEQRLNPATSNTYGNNINNRGPLNVLPQRAPILQQQPPAVNRVPLLDPRQQTLIGSSGQKQAASQQIPFQQTQLKPLKKVKPINTVTVPVQHKQSGGYYEHNKSTEHVKAYNYENQHHPDYPINQWQYDSLPDETSNSIQHEEPAQEAEAYDQYEPMAQEQVYDNFPGQQQQHPDANYYGYDNDTTESGDDNLEGVFQSTTRGEYLLLID